MAVDHLNPEEFPVSSPRISFSFNLRDLDAAQRAIHSPPPSNAATTCLRASDPRNDFEFRLSESLPSSADELFSDGKILAVPVKKKNVPERRGQADCPALPAPPSRKESMSCNNANTISPDLEAICDGGDMPHGGNLKDAKPSRSFWRLRRSSSLGSANSCSRRLCFLPLTPRSYSTRSSTGSSPLNMKQHRPRLPPPQSRATKNDLKASSSECFGSHYRQRARQMYPLLIGDPAAVGDDVEVHILNFIKSGSKGFRRSYPGLRKSDQFCRSRGELIEHEGILEREEFRGDPSAEAAWIAKNYRAYHPKVVLDQQYLVT